MTGRAIETQWYIARDGQQHGPLSDDEMRAFIERRFLRTTDLVWRPGFSDWRPAPLIFPMQTQPGAPLEGDGGAVAEQDQNLAGMSVAETASAAGGENPAAGRAADGTLRVASRARGGAVRGTAGSGPGRTTIALAAVLVLALGGGWLLWANRAELMRFAGGTLQAALFSGQDTAGARGKRAEFLDARLQRIPIWAAVKKAFPDWYGERLRELLDQPDGRSSDEAITRHLAEAFASLRRVYADAALSASTPRLHAVAEAFLDNLKVLSAESTGTCYAFISQGETSPAVAGFLQRTDAGHPMQRQLVAVTEAMAEGRASPVTHTRPNKTDYDALVSALIKLGWTKADLQLFANPRALAKATPEKVCQMVKDWFGAHMAIEDGGTRERLLTETLRPVVGN